MSGSSFSLCCSVPANSGIGEAIMGGALIQSPQSFSLCCSVPRTLSRINHSNGERSRRFVSSRNPQLRLREPPRFSFRCSSAGDPGENGSKAILDAFFLGKAVAETFNERAESALGELLSAIGRFQAEQQKQVQEFQEEVLEKAKRAKEQAAREAIEARRSVLRTPAAVQVTSNGGVSSTNANSPPETGSSAMFGSSDESNPTDEESRN